MSRRDATRAIAENESAVAESLDTQISELSEFDLAKLISFFRLLDKWDREVERNAKTM